MAKMTLSLNEATPLSLEGRVMRTEIDKKQRKLNTLLQRLKRGENVQNRDLQTWLGPSAYEDFLAECQAQKELRCELNKKPETVREYERRLKLALLAYNKGEGASGRGRHAAARRYFADADTLFERALEHLQEVIEVDPSLCVWFDRDTKWTPSNDIGLDPVKIPRVVTSRSLDNRSGGLMSRLQSKRTLKIAAVECALRELDAMTGNNSAETEKNQREQLERFLKIHDDA